MPLNFVALCAYALLFELIDFGRVSTVCVYVWMYVCESFTLLVSVAVCLSVCALTWL